MGFHRGSKSSRDKKKAEQQAKELAVKEGIPQEELDRASDANRLFAQQFGAIVVQTPEQRVANILRERERVRLGIEIARLKRQADRLDRKRIRKQKAKAAQEEKIARNEQRKQPQPPRERDPRLAIPGGVEVVGRTANGHILVQHKVANDRSERQARIEGPKRDSQVRRLKSIVRRLKSISGCKIAVITNGEIQPLEGQ